jgi:hypothetical protein
MAENKSPFRSVTKNLVIFCCVQQLEEEYETQNGRTESLSITLSAAAEDLGKKREGVEELISEASLQDQRNQIGKSSLRFEQFAA